MNKNQNDSKVCSKEVNNIFTQNQEDQSPSYMIQEELDKNHLNDDSISIYLEKSIKCRLQDNDESFIVQQLSQSSYLSTNQIQLYQHRQFEFQKHQKSPQVKRKIVFKNKKICKQSKESTQSERQKQKKRTYGSERKMRVSINQSKFEQMQILFEKNQKERLQGQTKTTLKQISELLNLGYSTVLHKYRQFRQFGTIQKGILLQCKDVRRKYKKSEQIQTKIVEALKVNTFHTAVQLAKFIADNYGLKVSRSIISRHLNQMRNQKIQQKVQKKKKIHIQKPEKIQLNQNFQNSQNTKVMSLGQLSYFNKFKKLILKMKQQGKPLYFFESFNIVLMDKTVFFQAGIDELLHSYINFEVLIVSLTSNGNQVINSSFQLVSSYQVSRFTDIIKSFIYVYVQERLSEILNIESKQRKCCLIYNFRANQRQKNQRQKLYRLADDKDVDMMFMPPDKEQLNFMRKWFYQNVFSEINTMKFTSSQNLKETVQKISLMKQNGFKQYSESMFQNILTLN